MSDYRIVLTRFDATFLSISLLSTRAQISTLEIHVSACRDATARDAIAHMLRHARIPLTHVTLWCDVVEVDLIAPLIEALERRYDDDDDATAAAAPPPLARLVLAPPPPPYAQPTWHNAAASDTAAAAAAAAAARLFDAITRLVTRARLHTLHFENLVFFDFRDAGADASTCFFRACFTSLRHLTLTHAVVTRETARLLAATLPTDGTCTLDVLEFIDCALAVAIHNPNADRLAFTRSTAPVLACMAHKIVYVRSLILNASHLDDDCVDVLAAALRDPGARCESLSLINNFDITNRGAQHLLHLRDDAVRCVLGADEWHRLRRAVGDDAARRIARFIAPGNSILRRIELDGTRVDGATLLNLNLALVWPAAFGDYDYALSDDDDDDDDDDGGVSVAAEEAAEMNQ